jgi:hypothetical protein
MSYGFGGWKGKVKVSTGSISDEDSSCLTECSLIPMSSQGKEKAIFPFLLAVLGF